MAEVRPGSTSAARSVAGPSSSSVSSSLALAGSVTARVHGSRTHHGTCNAPSTVLKTAACTGKRALSSNSRRTSVLVSHAAIEMERLGQPPPSFGGVGLALEHDVRHTELLVAAYRRRDLLWRTGQRVIEERWLVHLKVGEPEADERRDADR